jgi:hypothetical protein
MLDHHSIETMTYSLENSSTIKAEIDKIQMGSFIYAITYTPWVSNYVHVNKK